MASCVMSIQASTDDHACTPRNDEGPYSSVEIGYANQTEPLLMSYCDTPNIIVGCSPTLFVNVPDHTILAVVNMHSGLRHDSESLPPMVELDG